MIPAGLGRRGAVIAVCAMTAPALLGGCEAPGGPPLVSAQTPPGTGAVNVMSEPQPIGSLPLGAYNPGAAGLIESSPLTTHPNYGSFTFRPR